MTRLIRTDADVAKGAAWLAENVPEFETVLAQTGPLPLRLRPDGFAGLMEIIIGQQVSVASANAIKGRMHEAGLMDPENVRRADEEALRAVGLSRSKARYAGILAGEHLDYVALERASDAQVFDRLTAITGIGPWTAQVYIMFCLGRADMFPPGDLALQVAAQGAFGLDARPTAKELEVMAQEWSPWRSVAARALFAYYRVLKNREGLG